ncbi:DNA polymerase III subunit gamma/tau [Croceiramulus getboli]|nr:DNA polymerase III subunit gamma/tau [Flavobacteriaceae bacterium YJPT1-3]
MEQFIVSARKYRPETFADVVGQQAITNTLENAIANNHLAQALLFTGPRGVGKTTCARILAKRINADDQTREDEDFAFNIFELDAASNNSVDDIRNLIDQVRIPPQVGKYKVYIIDEVHMLSQAAFNAFLKTLEEPPRHAIFILATTEKHKIIPTILSRCQIFDFRRIMVKDIREHLVHIAKQEGIEAEEEALQVIAQKADGALRDALSTFDRVVSFCGNTLTRKAVTENLNVLDYDTYFKVTDLLLEGNIPELLLSYNEILAQGFDGHHFISGLASHFRDLMVCRNPATIPLLEVGENTKKQYFEQAQQTDFTFLTRAIELANDCDLKYKNSRNQRLLVELCLMQLASISANGEKKNDRIKILPPTAVPVNRERLNAMKRKTTEQSPSETPSESASGPSGIQSEEQVGQTSSAQAESSKDELDTAPAQTDTAVATQLPNIQRAKKPVSGLSIKGLQKKKELEEKQESQKVDSANLPREPFTEEQLLETWNKYIKKLQRKGGKLMASLLATDVPKLKGTTIHLELPNATMKLELERAQGELMEFLMKDLENYDIKLQITVNETINERFAYTPQEKYAKLKEQNPHLELLKKTFDLEL